MALAINNKNMKDANKMTDYKSECNVWIPDYLRPEIYGSCSGTPAHSIYWQLVREAQDGHTLGR